MQKIIGFALLVYLAKYRFEHKYSIPAHGSHSQLYIHGKIVKLWLIAECPEIDSEMMVVCPNSLEIKIQSLAVIWITLHFEEN